MGESNTVIPVLSFLKVVLKRSHNDCLLLSDTCLNADTARETVHSGNLDSELVVVVRLHACLCLERCICSLFLCEEERTDSSVRANDGALVTLNTLSSIPYRNIYCCTTLLVSCCTLRECTVFHTYECRYRERVTFLSVHYVNNLLDELRNSLLLNRLILSCLPGIRNVNCNNCINTCVDSSIVHLNDIVTLLTIRLESCLLHIVNSLVNRKDA